MVATSMRKQPTYSDSPAAHIKVEELAPTRFIDGEGRKYPYRDVLGRVNLNLVNSSLAEAEMDGAPPATCEKLAKWQRHAVRAINERPSDELMTLDELLQGDAPSPTSASSRAEAGDVPTTVATRTEAAMRRRLFSAPQAEDEPSFEPSREPRFDEDDDGWPSIDRGYLSRAWEEGAGKRPSRSRAGSPRKKREPQRVHATRANPEPELPPVPEEEEEVEASQSTSADDDLYEVEAILEEDEGGGRGFLIQWAAPYEDEQTWEPEWNVAPHLIAEFRKARDLARSHVGDDYLDGRKKKLWCSVCACHFAADSFSAQQRRVGAAKRQCLVHHYGGSGGAAKRTCDGSPARASTSAANAAVTGTPARPSAHKRPRAAEEDSPGGMQPPARPVKAARPVASALSHRQAAMEMRTSRLFGF